MQLTELQEKWLTALESGQYEQQTTGCLVTQEYGVYSYCCLAVGAIVLGYRPVGNYGQIEIDFDGVPYSGNLADVAWKALGLRSQRKALNDNARLELARRV